MVETSCGANVTGNVALRAAVANRQLLAATPAAQKPGEQCCAVFGCATISAVRCVLTDHLSDRLRALPVDVTFVHTRLQREPVLAGLAAHARPRNRPVVAYDRARLAIGIRAAIGGIGNDIMDG